MTHEQKQLLLKDLCARLPYGVIAQACGWDDGEETEVIVPVRVYSINTDGYVYFGVNEYNVDYCPIEDCTPYLRPISSMTDEEIIELYKAFGFYYLTTNYEITNEWISFKNAINNNKLFLPYPIWGDDVENGIKWLNRKMFDYRGLIPKGLALEAPENI